MARAQENNNWAPEEIAVAPAMAVLADVVLPALARHRWRSTRRSAATYRN
jgi:hypothetical protein